MSLFDKIKHFNNIKKDPTIINDSQISFLVLYLLEAINNKIEGDVVELGCYVGESSKYLQKTIVETCTDKKLYVYDSFEGLPPLSKYEENTGWTEGGLTTTEDVLKENFINNFLPLPTITKGWFKDIKDNQLPEKICFAFLDGDFYDSIYDSLNKVYDRVSEDGYIFIHDYDRADLPGVKAAVFDFFNERGYKFDIVKLCDQLAVIQKNASLDEVNIPSSPYTIVTGLWDIGRDKLSEGWSRSFNHYLNKLEELLKTDFNLIIFGEKELEEFVFKHRQHYNTQFIVRSLDWIKNMPFYNKIQEIRTNPDWYNQAGWLKDSTQAKLELYNPLVMSKVFLLNDASIMDKFNSEYLFWLDAGITNTVHPGYFTHDKVLDKLPELLDDKFLFVSFPYTGGDEIHGFTRTKMNEIANTKNVEYVNRAGFFGGPKSSITNINSIYYSLLSDTLRQGYMGTEESIFTLMTYLHPHMFKRFTIEDNGLLVTFFENLKNIKVDEYKESIKVEDNSTGTGLYVIGFNSPKQFQLLCESYLKHPGFIRETKNYLLNNSTDLSLNNEYISLCKKYNFEHIKKNNIGICGGRQFIAEHFEATNLKYYIFLEDDMTLVEKPGTVCRNGLSRYTPNLFYKLHKIIEKENYDFIKFSYTEFFGDNGTQWAWYNVPQVVRQRYWPHYCKLPEMGTDPNAPRTQYTSVKTTDELSYLEGDTYYCNWPQLVNREGNRKMFLNVKWAHPFEQTWMSHMFQLTKDNKLHGSVLLLSPVDHNRFDHYKNNLRKES